MRLIAGRSSQTESSFGVETSMTLSVWSRFSLALSASSALRRRAFDTSIPPHFDCHM